MTDPWQHRSINMFCSTCMWYVQKSGKVGRCRRHAPSMNGYPVVYENDWCGDHKVDEGKLTPVVTNTPTSAPPPILSNTKLTFTGQNDISSSDISGQSAEESFVFAHTCNERDSRGIWCLEPAGHASNHRFA